MSTSSNSDRPKTVYDILRDIESEVKVQYKSKDGQHYSSVPTRTLNSWSVALESAIKQQDSFSEAAQSSIKEAQRDLLVLQKSSENYEKTISQLKADIAIGKGKALEADKRLSKLIADNKESLAKAKQELADANRSKAETIRLVKLTEEELGAPDAKFLPDAALAIKNELKLLREELATANSRIASATAATSAGNKTIDTLSKELANAKKEEQVAVSKLMQFERERKGNVAGIIELFDTSKIDVEALTRAIGSKAVSKLKEALALDPTDARGRMTRLVATIKTGMHAATKGFATYLKQLLSVVDHALKVMKNNGNSWAAVLAPWVNEVLKDVAMLSTKSVTEYRKSLTLRIKAVSGLPKDAGLKAKLGAAKKTEENPLTWRDVGKKNRESLRKTLSLFSKAKARVSKTLQSFGLKLGKMISSVKASVVTATFKTRQGLVSFGHGSVRFARTLYSVIFIGVIPSEYAPKIDKGKQPSTGSHHVEMDDVLDQSLELDDDGNLPHN